LTAPDTYLYLPLKVRLVDNRDSQRTIRVLEGRDLEVLCGTDSIDANRSWACETEVAGESPETARDLKSIAIQANENGIATGGISRVVLRTPPVEVSGRVTKDKGLVPVHKISIDLTLALAHIYCLHIDGPL
jgi:hypothetical protein